MDKKTNYVLHYRNPRLYISLGIKIIKIHRVLNLSSLTACKNISILTLKKKKTNAANSFEKDFLKLMINSVYSKTRENL